MTLALYSVFVLIEMVLHLNRDTEITSESSGGALVHAGKTDWKLILLMDFLQIPLSLVFTRFLNLFSAVIPDLYSDGGVRPGRWRFGQLCCPCYYPDRRRRGHVAEYADCSESGDGIVQAIADTIRKSVGFTKNCFDLTNITITLILSFCLRDILSASASARFWPWSASGGRLRYLITLHMRK